MYCPWLAQAVGFNKPIRVSPCARQERISEQGLAHGSTTGFRALGTSLPGVITAGRFVQDGRWTFWDVSNPGNAIVIELQNERLSKLVVEVEDPRGAVILVSNALSAYRTGKT